MNFDDVEELRGVSTRRREKEPLGDFPLGWYEEFLREIVARGIEVITFRDLFEKSDDWDYTQHYRSEFKSWHKTRNKDRIYLLLQHDVDNHPDFTERMLALEALYGVRSNVFIFVRRYTKRDGGEARYPVDHSFLQAAERAGFVIGYHQNAFQLSGFDMEKAEDIYRNDVAFLRQHFKIDFMVPHGGVGAEIGGVMKYNHDVPMPAEFEDNLRWVFNRYGATFTSRFSDGGIRKSQDLDRLRRSDIIGGFLDGLKPGTRNFCLVHPQRWGMRVHPSFNPLLEQQPWHRRMIERYSSTHVIERSSG